MSENGSATERLLGMSWINVAVEGVVLRKGLVYRRAVSVQWCRA